MRWDEAGAQRVFVRPTWLWPQRLLTSRGARDDLDFVWREREGRYRTRELHLASVVHVRIKGSYGAVPAAHHETLWPAEQ